VDRGDPDRRQDAPSDADEAAEAAAAREDAQHPDRARPRGNPEVEQIDVDRGLGKIERVSGN